MTLLTISVLTYSGEIILKKKGGGVVTASDLQDVLKKGIGEFKDIPYATLETDFPVEAVSRLFRVLGLNQGLVRNSKDRTKAVQDFRKKALDIEETLGKIERDINTIKTGQNPVVDVEKLSEKAKDLERIPLQDFLKVKTVSDFKKVEYTEEEVKEISSNLKLMGAFSGLLKDYNEFIQKDYLYMENAIKWMDDYQMFFPESDRNPLIEIRSDCKPLVMDVDNLLDPEKRRMLKGKLGQFKRNYSSLYFAKHSKIIGEGINWDKLSSVSKSGELRKLRDMAAIRVVNTLGLKKIEERILKLDNSRCTRLLEEHLKTNYYCVWCSFPSNISGISDINGEITKIDQDLHATLEEWTKLILNEIESYSDNISLLSKSEQEIIKKIAEEKKLPAEISQDLIDALNSLFSELTEIEISPSDILDHVFSDQNVLDFDSFSKKLDDYKEEILARGNRKNIRIMRKEE
jgi:hypothetical protein